MSSAGQSGLPTGTVSSLLALSGAKAYTCTYSALVTGLSATSESSNCVFSMAYRPLFRRKFCKKTDDCNATTTQLRI